MTFIDDAGLAPLDATTYGATLAPTWRSMLDLHGGYVAAITARAVELTVDDPSPALRSFTTQFIRPAKAGPVTVAIDVTKAGRSALLPPCRRHAGPTGGAHRRRDPSGPARGGLDVQRPRRPTGRADDATRRHRAVHRQ